MKRLLTATAVASIALIVAGSAWASVYHVEQLKWHSNRATIYDASKADTAYFSSDGSANATRDTSVSFPGTEFAPELIGRFTPAGDSTLWLRLTIYPRVGSSYTPGADSIYAYIQASDDNNNWAGLTNMTEILLLTTSSTGSASAGISMARALMQGQGRKRLRVILRGDMNGQFEGDVGWYTSTSSLLR
jgi:hypothetical protein